MMEQRRQPIDPWSSDDYAVFADLPRPDPSQVLRFWEWKLRAEHWSLRLSDSSLAAKNRPQLFWDKLSSHLRLKRLCTETERKHTALLTRLAHPSIPPAAIAKKIREEAKTIQGGALRCHAVLLVLEGFHRRERDLCDAGRDISLEPTRKQKQRSWQSVREKLAAISPEQWERLGATTSQIRRFTERAEQFAQNPPNTGGGLRFVLLGLKSAKSKTIMHVNPPAPLPDPPKKGNPHDPESRESRLNIEIASLHELLSDLLEDAVSFIPCGPTLLSLLQHVNPTEFSPAGGDSSRGRAVNSLKKRVQSATTLDRESLDRALASYRSSAQTLLRPN